MKMRFFPFFIIFLIVFGIFGTFFLKIENKYDSEISEIHLSRNFSKNFNYSFSDQKNVWYIGLEKDIFSEKDISTSDVCVVFLIDGKNITECLDMEDTDETGEFYSFPIISSPSHHVEFSVINRHGYDISENFSSATLYAMNTLPIGKKLALTISPVQADNMVISRAEWGADETLRYVDHPRQQARYARTLAYAKRPKTDGELNNLKLIDDSNDFIKKELGSDFETMSLIRYENGHTLVWPIQKTKRVNKIIIHHTAENLDGYKSDETLIRAIYAYHAVTRGWGDIGYNYLVGQTGKIYEGRAGGAYVVGAHAQNNNIGSVGISVLGNYQDQELNSFRRIGLENAIDMVAKKYGITLTDSVVGFKKCTSKNCYPLQKITTKALLGHRDVGVTNCPGNHIYNIFPEIFVKLNRSYLPVINPVRGSIDEQPDAEKISYVRQENQLISIPSVPTTVASDLKNIQYLGPKMRVKLSYPNTNITLSSYGNLPAKILLDSQVKNFSGKSVYISPFGKNKMRVEIDGNVYYGENFSFSAPVVSVDSWMRIPDWDKQNKYNDNLFRDTIEIFNDNGKLLLINHLPVEFYLKGLGEVSNSDLPEKIKTITVAARGYAEFYMMGKNRKYNTYRYDGSDDPDSFQKYLGYSYELRSPNVSKMVDATRGKIIYYKNEPIKPWYFSVSDGKTLSYYQYCQKNLGKNCENIPYLPSVSDSAGIGKVRSGHGVGISGIGATEFAKQGWSYEKIIEYYMPGVIIK